MWNSRTGRPHHNAIVWQDTRADALGENGGSRSLSNTDMSAVDELRFNWLAYHNWNLNMAACVRSVHIAQGKKAVERSLVWVDR